MNRTAFRAVAASLATSSLVLVMGGPALAADSPIPKPKPVLPKELAQKLSTMVGIFAALGLVAAICGVIGVGITMVISYRRGELGEHMQAIGIVLFGSILIGAASSIALFAA